MTHSHRITDVEIAKQFVYASNAKLTLVSKKTGTRFTYKVRQREGDDGSKTPFFVSVLNGPDNWDNYQYIGFLPKDNGGLTNGFKLVGGRKGHPDAPSFKAFDWFIRAIHFKSEIPETLEVWHEGQCAACGRALTVPASIATGFGPTCAARLGIELVDPSDDDPYIDEHIEDEDGEQALLRQLETNDEHREEMERDDAMVGHDPYAFDDSIDDLLGSDQPEEHDDEGVPELPGAGRFAINF